MSRFLHNWELKIISLGLAVLLWTHVRGEVNPLETAEVEAPLRLNVPRGWAVTSKVPTRATVTLSGPRLALRDLRGGTISNPLLPPSSTRLRIVVAPLQAKSGEQQVALSGDANVSDVEVLGVKPTSLSVKLQRAPHGKTKE